MLETLLRNRRLGRQMASDHLRIIQQEFAPHLRCRGHAPSTVLAYCRAVAGFVWWWVRTRGSQGPLRFEDRSGFLCQRRDGRLLLAPNRQRVCRAAVGRLFDFLRRRHHWRPPLPREAQPRATERVLVKYDRYLRSVCGLAEASRKRLQREARDFLAWLSRRRKSGRQLGPADLRRYMAHRAGGLSAGSIRALGARLRTFVRFLESRRRVAPGLAGSVPVYAPWPKRPLAPALGERELRRFLSSWNRATAQGRRDYAMALCLAEMGLRAGEVAGLSLEDLDWRAMTLRLPETKQRRERLLPLPPSVGKALVNYIQRGRPVTPNRAVFVHHRVPKGRPLHAYDVSRVMRQALARGGIGEGSAHLLRHTLATRWHRQGVDLKAIADWLGHRDLDTTAEYALVDIPSLRQVALPWPQALR